LMARVHMLYGHNRAVMGFLLSILVAEIGLMGIAVVVLQRRLEFSPACLITKTPRIVAYFGSGGMITHVCILIFTLLPVAMHKGWGDVPIISYIIRDGLLAFLVISSLLLVTLLHDTFRHEVASIVFSGFISIASSAGCRLIINLHNKTSRLRDSDSDTGFQLSTSIFETTSRPSSVFKTEG